MPFKIPTIKHKQIDSNIPQFDIKNCIPKEHLAQGSFGEVFTAEYKEYEGSNTSKVVIKKMLQVRRPYIN